MKEYSPLDHAPLPAGSRLVEPQHAVRVGLDDPAAAVMTDLREVMAATTTPHEAMERAQQVMIARGVRLLFVLERDGTIAGVITATDILGEKPLRLTQSRGMAHADVAVSDVMTPAAMLEALPLAEVEQMRVGHVVATFKAVRRQHLLVADGDGCVRGLFSASQLARQLGVDLQTFEVARTFADIEAALVR